MHFHTLFASPSPQNAAVHSCILPWEPGPHTMLRTRHLSAVRAVWSALNTQCTVNLEHSNALSTQCTRSNGHSALSATHLIGTECSVRASCVVPCAREPRRPPWTSLSLSLPLTRALPRLDLPVSVLACDVRQPIENLREIEKFIIRQPPKGEKDDYDSENSWISDGLPSSSRRRRRGDGR